MPTMKRSRCLKLIAVLIFIIPVFSYAQKVGLVLSGGGARGVAHIGVIRALEEHGIPVDYIAGTSFGAIIGGLYACGWSCDEMEELVLSSRFQQWATGQMPQRYMDFYKQNRPNAAWVKLKFNFDSVFVASLPSSIISPSGLDFGLMEIFSGADAVSGGDFDSLFVPFRCVAADVAQKRQYILRHGNLGRSIRASMTFPLYFSPIRIDNKLLFDGGMYNNFPVDVMQKDFHPDVILGSKVASNFGPPRDNDIISQLTSMMVAPTDYQAVKQFGFLIEPELEYVNVTDFSRTREYIDSGYVAGLRMMKLIQQKVIRRMDTSMLNKKRMQFIQRKPALEIDSVIIKGLNPWQRHYVQQEFMVKKREKRIPLKLLKTPYFAMLSDNKIARIDPLLQFNKQKGDYNLVLDVEQAKNVTAEIGGLISSNPVNEAYFGLKYKFFGSYAFSLHANSYIGRFYSSVLLGGRADFNSVIPWYIEGEVSYNQYDFFKTSTYFFEDKTPSYLVQDDNQLRFNLGVPMGFNARFDIGITGALNRDKYYQTNIFKRNDTTDVTGFEFYSPWLSVEYNTLNKKQYPSHGRRISFWFRLVNGIEKHVPGSTAPSYNGLMAGKYEAFHHWISLRLQMENYFSLAKRVGGGLSGELVLSDQPLFNNYTASLLAAPAYHPIPESRTLFLPAFRAHNFVGSGAHLNYALFKRFEIRTQAHVFFPLWRIVEKNQGKPELGHFMGFSAGMGAAAIVFHTPIGPAALKLSFFEGEVEPWSLFFSFGYTIFNRRALE